MNFCCLSKTKGNDLNYFFQKGLLERQVSLDFLTWSIMIYLILRWINWGLVSSFLDCPLAKGLKVFQKSFSAFAPVISLLCTHSQENNAKLISTNVFWLNEKLPGPYARRPTPRGTLTHCRGPVMQRESRCPIPRGWLRKWNYAIIPLWEIIHQLWQVCALCQNG